MTQSAENARSQAEKLLYRAIRELEYVQSVENCHSGLCASAEGKAIIEAGCVLLGTSDFSAEELDGTV